jgi:hypothetical protein
MDSMESRLLNCSLFPVGRRYIDTALNVESLDIMSEVVSVNEGLGYIN